MAGSLPRDGEAALRAAQRRWRRAPHGGSPRASHGPSPQAPHEEGRQPAAGGPPAWWPRLTPGQVQALVGAAITLAIALWEHLPGRLER
jgi:hypothetical protein